MFVNLFEGRGHLDNCFNALLGEIAGGGVITPTQRDVSTGVLWGIIATN